MRDAVDTVAVVFPHHRPAAPADPAPGGSEGTAAEAIRAAEAALARQNSVAAQVDLQVVAAVLNAHTTHAGGAVALEALQREIESAVATRTDLDTPAGARSFQRYLIDKLHDIRTVVETTNLDDSSKAALAAALSSLYATAPATDGPADAPGEDSGPAPDTGSVPGDPAPGAGVPDTAGAVEFLPPVDLGLDGVGLDGVGLDGTPPWDASAAPAAAPPIPGPFPGPAPAPSWGGGLPGPALPSGGGLPALSGPLLPGLRPLGAEPAVDLPGAPDRREEDLPPDADREDPDADEPGRPAGDAAAEEPNAVLLPSGEIITAPSPALADAIEAALAGTPVPQAYAAHGMALPEPGSPVPAPLEPGRLAAGDIGMLTDRHAVALGNGDALLDGRIIAVAGVSGPGFLGWLRPPDPEPAGLPAQPPTPDTAG